MTIDKSKVDDGRVVEFYAAALLSASGCHVRHLERENTVEDQGDLLCTFPSGRVKHIDVKQAMEWKVSTEDIPFAHVGIAQVSKFHRDWMYLIFSLDMNRFIRFLPWTIPEEDYIVKSGKNKWDDTDQRFLCIPRECGTYSSPGLIMCNHATRLRCEI